MQKIRFIGDVHAKIDKYIPLTYNIEKSVQLGDMGAGFVDIPVFHAGCRWIRGNHDNPKIAFEHPRCIRDGTVEGDIMYLGGAWSIDRAYRTEGVDWWPDEELSILELDNCISTAIAQHPKIMVTHDCPEVVLKDLFGYIHTFPNRTSQALNTIYDYCKPDIWIFGHHHQNVDMVVGRTRFICLDELKYIDLEV